MPDGGGGGGGGHGGNVEKRFTTDGDILLENLLVDFRKEAAQHGMHDQVVELCERYIVRAARLPK